MVRAVHLQPRERVRVGDYDLDAFAIEHEEDGTVVDVRLELGEGLGIYWAFPAARGDRLRLAHVDGAAYTVDEPVLIEDPFVFDLPRLSWEGDLAELGGGRVLTSVSVNASASPPRFECIVVTKDAGGARETTTFSWSGS